MVFDQEAVRREFPILQRQLNGSPLVYLDNGATTQKPQAVIDAISTYYARSNSNVGRSVHGLSAEANGLYEGGRARVAKFVNARQHSEIVFTKSATESINFVAGTIGRERVEPGDEVIVTELEHHANLVPWQALCQERGAILKVAPIRSESGEIDVPALVELLTARTKIVAVAHVSNVLGTVTPVRSIVEECRRRGILSVVDGAQAVAHEPVDVQELGCDFYCFSGHKMYAPMGIGVLYGRAELFEGLGPFLKGGGGVMGVAYDRVLRYKPAPFRFETGTPNVEGVVGLTAAIEFLERLGRAEVAAYERRLLDLAVERLEAIDGLRLIGSTKARSAILSFVREGFHAFDIGEAANKAGIALSTGAHCANPLLDKLGLVATVRVAIAPYNTAEEIELLAEVVAGTPKGIWSLERPNARF
jgi:cysteine desulfurase/selenocysteine lyase